MADDRLDDRLSDAEWVVMRALWEGAPASAREVRERLAGRRAWAYTTVKTLLDRLVDKGLVAVRKRGNAGAYEPRVSRAQARRGALRGLLERAFDGAFGSLVQHLVSEERLSAPERAELARLLAEQAAPRRRRASGARRKDRNGERT